MAQTLRHAKLGRHRSTGDVSSVHFGGVELTVATPPILVPVTATGFLLSEHLDDFARNERSIP